MGVATGALQVRDENNVSNACLATMFNAIHALIIDCGMLQLSEEEFAGQAGTFVDGEPGPGETQVVRQGGAVAGSALGYKVYKHPTLSLYVQVRFTFYGSNSAAFGAVEYVFGRGVAGGSFYGQVTGIVRPIGFTTLSVYTGSMLSDIRPMIASCGDDHFWIYSEPNAIAATNTAYYSAPGSFSAVGVGVFAGENPSRLLVVHGLTNAPSSSYIIPPSPSTLGTVAATNYILSASPVVPWEVLTPGAAGYLSEPEISNNIAGVRVARAQKIIDGEVERFNFGFINMAAVTEMAIINNLDLTGGGEAAYRALRAFGPSNPASTNMTTSKCCCPVFPWAGD